MLNIVCLMWVVCPNLNRFVNVYIIVEAVKLISPLTECCLI